MLEPLDETDDLELVIRYLNRGLVPEKARMVEERLANDSAFRLFAAPMIVMWSFPPKGTREPIPREQLERDWDEFTKKAGFVHQKRKARRRRFIAIGYFAFGAAVAWASYAASCRSLRCVSSSRRC
jgi:hypothetical protein